MTYETYRNIFMICAAAGGIMAFVSVLLFVLLRIPSVIGDLTGITAKRGIEQIRSKDSKARNRKYGAGTEKLQNIPVSEETTLLSSDAANETTLLSSDAANETTLLSSNAANETTILQPEFGILEDITILHTEEEI